MKFWLLAVLTPGVMAVSDSVWDQAAAKQHTKNVLIKSISVEGDNIVVTVVEADEKAENRVRETVELCSQSRAGDFVTANDFMRTELLQQAFNQGRAITVQFSGTFNRCISKIKASVQDAESVKI